MPSKKKKYNSRFPPARIKKIMQSDDEVGKVAAVVPIIISRVLEMFVENLLKDSSKITKQRNARTLTPAHLKACIFQNSHLFFLKEIVSMVQDIQQTGDEDPLDVSNAISYAGHHHHPHHPLPQHHHLHHHHHPHQHYQMQGCSQSAPVTPTSPAAHMITNPLAFMATYPGAHGSGSLVTPVITTGLSQNAGISLLPPNLGLPQHTQTQTQQQQQTQQQPVMAASVSGGVGRPQMKTTVRSNSTGSGTGRRGRPRKLATQVSSMTEDDDDEETMDDDEDEDDDEEEEEANSNDNSADVAATQLLKIRQDTNVINTFSTPTGPQQQEDDDYDS